MYRENKNIVLSEVNTALEAVDADSIEQLVTDILNADKVFLTGVGRVLLSLQAFAKRLSHLGINANCVGDITEPAATSKSLVIVASGSGCSVVPVAICKKAKELNCKIIHIGSNPFGDVAEYVDHMVRIPVRTRLYLEDEMESKQPMTSLFEQSLLLLGDIVSMMIIDMKQINIDDMWSYHANLE